MNGPFSKKEVPNLNFTEIREDTAEKNCCSNGILPKSVLTSESIAVSLFGNVTVNTGEILINTNTIIRQNKRSQ